MEGGSVLLLRCRGKKKNWKEFGTRRRRTHVFNRTNQWLKPMLVSLNLTWILHTVKRDREYAGRAGVRDENGLMDGCLAQRFLGSLIVGMAEAIGLLEDLKFALHSQ